MSIKWLVIRLAQASEAYFFHWKRDSSLIRRCNYALFAKQIVWEKTQSINCFARIASAFINHYQKWSKWPLVCHIGNCTAFNIWSCHSVGSWQTRCQLAMNWLCHWGLFVPPQLELFHWRVVIFVTIDINSATVPSWCHGVFLEIDQLICTKCKQ